MTRNLVSPDLYKHLVNKFVGEKHWHEDYFRLALGEFEKFFRLALLSEGSFLPTTRHVDEIWHACILETLEYATLCESVAPGKFLHHSGITYCDYAKDKSAEDLLSEDLSWLASYVANFGGYTLETVEFWPFASHMIRTHSWNVSELNEFALEMTPMA